MSIAVACGGTGGHIFPGLVTAKELRRRGHEVTLWLSGRDVEARSVQGWGGAVECVRASGFPSGFSVRSVRSGCQLAAAVAGSLRRMRRARPAVLLAMGSYASVGPALAARALGIPVVVHEANSIPGRAVEFLSRFAAAAGITFDSAASWLHCSRVVRTGLPIRDDLDARFDAGELEDGLFTVLVTGGSQGAHVLNRVATEALCRMAEQGRGVQVVHLAGPADADWVRKAYEAAGVPHRVFDFLHEMGKAYGAADLAVSRAGAGTCMELSACRVPAILVPLPGSMRGHQAANAESMAKVGAAEVIAQEDLTPDRLLQAIEGTRRDSGRLASMRKSLAELAILNAAGRLADLVLSLSDDT